MVVPRLWQFAKLGCSTVPDPYLPCGEQPHWIFGRDLGAEDWARPLPPAAVPPLPWRQELWSQPISASLVVFFVGSTKANTAVENAALAKFGHVGLGWQHADSIEGSHEGHIEKAEQRTAAEPDEDAVAARSA